MKTGTGRKIEGRPTTKLARDKIFEVAEGGLTDGEPMIFAFGNPTRAGGKFHRITYGS